MNLKGKHVKQKKKKNRFFIFFVISDLKTVQLKCKDLAFTSLCGHPFNENVPFLDLFVSVGKCVHFEL